MKKSIAIIGEGETEWFYFESLRVKCRYPFKVAPDFPQHSNIGHVVKLVGTYVGQEYDYVICLVDMDRLLRIPKEMAHKRLNKNTKLYCYLTENGDLQRAIENADYICEICKKNPEDAKSYSEVQKVFGILKESVSS